MLARFFLVSLLILLTSGLQAKESSLNGEGLAKLAQVHVTKHGNLKYLFGSADPKRGGFDCSGAIYYVLRQAGLKPPRTSAQQYTWVKDAGKLHAAKGITSLSSPAFKNLQAGHLLFWSGTYRPTDGRKVNITHVGIYLGKQNGKHLMASSSSGRSRNGKRLNGYKVTDFTLPNKSSKVKFEGYGLPPGIRASAKRK